MRRCCRLPWGYSAHVRDASAVPSRVVDQLDSYFFAETLKYLFLLFSPPEALNLTSHVLTTEAHVLPVHPLAQGAAVHASEPVIEEPPVFDHAWW